MTTKRDATLAALAVTEDIDAGRIDPAALDVELIGQCRELFGVVAGPGDALWPLQLDIARQVIARGGVSVGELSEWQTVLRQRAAEKPEALSSSIESAGTDSPGSGPHSPEIAGSELPPSDPEDA